jgi:hypothetical protein
VSPCVPRLAEVARVKFSLWSKHCTVYAMVIVVGVGVAVPVMESEEERYMEEDGGRIQAVRRAEGELGQFEVISALVSAAFAALVSEWR